MAIYKRDVDTTEDIQEPGISPCLTMRFLVGTMDCFATVTLCGDEYTITADGKVVINVNKVTYCDNLQFANVPIMLLAQTTVPFYNNKGINADLDKKYGAQSLFWDAKNHNHVPGNQPVAMLSYTVSGGNPTLVQGSITGAHINFTNQNLMPKLAEWHIYGNEQQGRFAIRKPDAEPLYYLDNLTNDVKNKNFFRILDKKEYELKDHLGNVRVAIGDMKLPTATPGVPPFKVDEKAINEYYPFGMIIKDRSWSTANYRYGYNGKENDNEVKGTANSIDYGARIYDPRAARFLSRDPLTNKFPWNSPYLYAGNNPIESIDEDGKAKISIHYDYVYKVMGLLKMNLKYADEIAYLSSTWADNPDLWVIEYLNSNRDNLQYRGGHPNSRMYSQKNDLESVQFHSQKLDNEKHWDGSPVTSYQATVRGMNIGWNEIIDGSKKNDKYLIASGLHRLVDAYYHEGISFSNHLGLGSISEIWSSAKYLFLDNFTKVEGWNVTFSAVVVSELYKGNNKPLEEFIKDTSGFPTFDFNGMGQKELGETLEIFKKNGRELAPKEKTEGQIYKLKGN